MKITPWFIHPQAILGVYDFLLSNESELFKKMSWLFQALTLEWMVAKSLKPKKVHPSIIKSTPHDSGRPYEAKWKSLCQKNNTI